MKEISMEGLCFKGLRVSFGKSKTRWRVQDYGSLITGEISDESTIRLFLFIALPDAPASENSARIVSFKVTDLKATLKENLINLCINEEKRIVLHDIPVTFRE